MAYSSPCSDDVFVLITVLAPLLLDMTFPSFKTDPDNLGLHLCILASSDDTQPEPLSPRDRLATLMRDTPESSHPRITHVAQSEKTQLADRMVASLLNFFKNSDVLNQSILVLLVVVGTYGDSDQALFGNASTKLSLTSTKHGETI